MKLLREGMLAAEVIETILAGDPLRESRQILLVDAAGRTAAFPGSSLPEYSGLVEGDAFVIGGCGLAGGDLLTECARVFETTDGDLPQRLLATAAVAADSQANRAAVISAALRVSRDAAYPYIDLRVDSHEKPVHELSQLFALWREKNSTPPPPAQEPENPPNQS